MKQPAPTIKAPTLANPIGIDLGLKDLATLSDGRKVEARRFYRDLDPALAAAQRAVKKARARAIHAKIANRRKDFLHKLSTQLVREHGCIVVGDVNAKALAQGPHAKSDDAAVWSVEYSEKTPPASAAIAAARPGLAASRGCPCTSGPAGPAARPMTGTSKRPGTSWRAGSCCWGGSLPLRRRRKPVKPQRMRPAHQRQIGSGMALLQKDCPGFSRGVNVKRPRGLAKASSWQHPSYAL